MAAADSYTILETIPDFRKLQKNSVYIIKDEVKMRGIDYQAEEGGIELLICSPFSCDRAYQ